MTLQADYKLLNRRIGALESVIYEMRQAIGSPPQKGITLNDDFFTGSIIDRLIALQDYLQIDFESKKITKPSFVARSKKKST